MILVAGASPARSKRFSRFHGFRPILTKWLIPTRFALACHRGAYRSKMITMRKVPHAAFVLLAVFANWWGVHLAADPAHSHPYLMPSGEKQRLLQRLRSSE